MASKLNLVSQFPWASPSLPFIVSAPMRVMAGPALATAVSRAGGLGFIGPGLKTQDIEADLEEATKLIGKANNATLSSTAGLLPVGVGFQLWADNIDVAVDQIHRFMPCAAWLYAPRKGHEEYSDWSRRIRQASPRTQIWIQIGTLKEAQQLLAMQDSDKPDVVVVQGAEAGGHGRANDGMGLVSLFPEVADAMAGSGMHLLAAGGIADGRGAAAALCLGAEGVVMGTRFLAASEARIKRGYQNEVVRASDGAASTTRTLLYNHLRGTFGWPSEYSPRTIINKSHTDHQAGVSFEELKRRHDEAAAAGDDGWGPDGRLATYAGASVGLIHQVKSAQDIVRDVQTAAVEMLHRLNTSYRHKL